MACSHWQVIIADDQEPVRDSICEMVETAGHTVLAAVGTGEEAVARTLAEHPDIVLMDIQMPGMGGIAAARQIRALPQPVPVVFLTAFGDEEVAQEAVRSGGFGYLVKPFHVRQLGPVMQTAMERFRELQETRWVSGRLGDAREDVEAFRQTVRSAGMEQAVQSLVTAVGLRLQVESVAVCLSELGPLDISVPACWGRALPVSALRWARAMAHEHQACHAAAGALDVGSPALSGAPLGGPDDTPGLLLAAIPSSRSNAVELAALLAHYADALGEALAVTRTQQPITWRRWVQRGRLVLA